MGCLCMCTLVLEAAQMAPVEAYATILVYFLPSCVLKLHLQIFSASILEKNIFLLDVVYVCQHWMAKKITGCTLHLMGLPKLMACHPCFWQMTRCMQLLIVSLRMPALVKNCLSCLCRPCTRQQQWYCPRSHHTGEKA